MPPMSRERPLRVHVLIDSLNWGGAETLLAEYAAGARRVGIEVSVAHLSDRPGAEHRLRDQGIEPTLLDVHGLLSRRNRRRVRDHLVSVEPDLLHTHLGYSDFYGGLAARSLGIPAVSTLHTMEDASGLREWTKEWLMAWARRRSAYRVIAVSDALRRHYLATGRDSETRVVAVHNGIVGDAEPGAGARIRSALGIEPESFVVGMLSVLRLGKGHDVAASAVASLADRFPQIRLLVLGTGPDEREIAETLAPLGDKVIMAGHRDDVLATLDAVDALVHPSQVDALPTALMEAMAARVPVVATRVGGIPEIMGEEETGLLIDAPPKPGALAAAIERLLTDGGLRARLADAGRARFEAEFSVERWFERLLPIYEGAIAAQPASGSARRAVPVRDVKRVRDAR
jgi:glycosyltransferase involved in cell wall biosynthesis